MSDAEGLRFSSARGRWTLAATVLGSGIAFIDATVVGIALPTIGREFHADIAGLQWVTVGYMLTLSGLLLLGGALGDRFGRRRIFTIGVVWFAAASLLCAVAPNVTFLIVARTVQGIGGALLTPGSLAILEASFVPGDRARAIGAWSGLGGIAGAVAPFLGGFLISALSWRFIFLINLPLTAAVVYLALRHVPESRDTEERGRLDYVGSGLAVLAFVGVCYGLVEGPDLGFANPVVLVSLIGGLVAFALFGLTETRVSEPIVPLSLFRSRQFTATQVVTLLVYAVLGGIFFLAPIELQQVAHYTPLESGVAFLPVTGLLLVLSARSGQLASRIGPRLQMSAGPIIVAIAIALYTRIDANGNYLTEVLPAVLAFGVGLAVTVAPLTSTALSSAPARHAGLASAVNNTVARTGSLLAVAILPPLAGITGASYLHPAVFQQGFQRAVTIAAMVCACGGLLAAATIRNPRHDAGITPARTGTPPLPAAPAPAAVPARALDPPPAR